jgi:hypothetical protein
MMMMDVDEFLVPAAALASTGLPRAVLLSPSSAEEEASVTSALSQLLPRTVEMLLEGVSGAAGGGERVAGEAGGEGSGGGSRSGRGRSGGSQGGGQRGEGVTEVSGFKLAWLPFSSNVAAGQGREREVTIERFEEHAPGVVPEEGRMIGDRQNGKMLCRGHVHTDFSGHSATIPERVGNVHEAQVATVFIAHYIGRQRSYASANKQHQAVVHLRRQQIDSGPMTRWRNSPLCFFRLIFRRHLCTNVTPERTFFPPSSSLNSSICAANARDYLQQLQQCLHSGDCASPYPFVLP